MPQLCIHTDMHTHSRSHFSTCQGPSSCPHLFQPQTQHHRQTSKEQGPSKEPHKNISSCSSSGSSFSSDNEENSKSSSYRSREGRKRSRKNRDVERFRQNMYEDYKGARDKGEKRRGSQVHSNAGRSAYYGGRDRPRDSTDPADRHCGPRNAQTKRSEIGTYTYKVDTRFQPEIEKKMQIKGNQNSM